MAEQAEEDTVVPELPTTEQAELAWSAANDADDLFLPASWRPNRPGWVLRDHQRPQHPRLSGRGSHDGAGDESGDARGPQRGLGLCLRNGLLGHRRVLG